MVTLFQSILLLLAALFMGIACIGLFRMPDFYTKMAAVSKASTLGLLLILAAHMITAPSIEKIVLLSTALFFVAITSPLATHLLGRNAYLKGVKLHPQTQCDEWKGKDG